MTKMNRILLIPGAIAALGFAVAVLGEKDLGINAILIGFSLFILIMLIFVWLQPAKTIGPLYKWGARLSVTGFAVIGLPMAYAFWHREEPQEITWNIGLVIFLSGMVVNYLQHRKGNNREH